MKEIKRRIADEIFYILNAYLAIDTYPDTHNLQGKQKSVENGVKISILGNTKKDF